MLNTDDLLTASAAIATVALILTAVQLLPTTFVRPLLPPEGAGILQPRLAAIDGLRAFLALAVVFLHAWAFRDTYFEGKPFDLPRYPFFCESGLVAVLVFFMITGFLFWNKAVVARGRVNPFLLYRNRARRILPLYYFLCCCTVAVVFLRSSGKIGEPIGILLREIAGLIVPGLRTAGPLLGSERKVMLAQSWTLYFEDLFYLALPILGLAARSRRTSLTLVLSSLLLLMMKRVEFHRYDYFSLSFLVGIGVAELLICLPNVRAPLSRKPFGLLILLLPLLVPWLTRGTVTPLVFICAAVSFVGVAAGNDLFGLLKLRCVRIVGTLSYSIYLLHMLILYCGLTFLNRLTPIKHLAPFDFSMVVCVAGIIVVAISIFSYRYIEKPWMQVRDRL